MTRPSRPTPATSPPGPGSRQSDRAVLVVDDHVTFAEAFASMLDDVPGLRAFAATTVADAQRALAEHEIDVVLLEVHLDGHDGIWLARQFLSQDPDLRVIVVTVSEDVNQVVDAVRVGVSGWVPKNAPAEHLVSVVRGVLRGETWIPPPLLTPVLGELTSAERNTTAQDTVLSTLTRREKEVLDLLMLGGKTDDIAQRLCLSRNTLRTHIRRILRKLDVHSVLAAVALARRAEMARLRATR